MNSRLDVYLRGQMVGVLQQDGFAALSFAYHADYLASESPRAISVSMPLTETEHPQNIAHPYFAGLLPDESARTRLAETLGVSDTNAFGMLEIMGGECAGALALFPEGSTNNPLYSPDETLDEQQLANLLQELRTKPLLGGRSDVRLSLAGPQDKIAVKLKNDSVVLVKNGEPTTHILKPAIQGLEGSSQNETFCMRLAAQLGISTPEVRFAKACGTEYILVERFDRIQTSENTVQRLHQEDFCQALSMPPEFKHEDEGGPDISRSLDLIQRVTDQPVADRLSFLKMQIFHFLIGNADAHAKNFALLYPLNAKLPSLAPAYDVLSTAVYPQLTTKMAMRIGEHNLPDTIQRKHWLSLVPDTKASHKLLFKELTHMANAIITEAEVLRTESQKTELQHPILNDICRVINTRASMVLQSIA